MMIGSPFKLHTKKIKKINLILHPLLYQLGWRILPPIIIMATMQDIIHTTTTKHPQDLHNPNSKIHKLMESFSQIGIKYLTHIILNKRKLEKKQAPVPLD
jgi:hypothetical protein